VAGRASVWNDPVVRDLTTAFVPATDESWRLQTSDDRQARAFRMIVDGRPDPVGGSRQGTYVLTPGGELLARGNSTDPRKIEGILRRGLEAWSALADEARSRPVPMDLLPEHRFEESFPEDGLVLEAIIQDRPGVEADARGRRWNIDHAWFSAAEVEAWWKAIEPTIGRPRPVPAPPAMLDRLVRYHLVDNARGQEAPFAPEEVREAGLTATVLPEEDASEPGRLRVDLEGRTAAETDGRWRMGRNLWASFNRGERPRGVETELLGYAEFERETGRVVSFRLIAFGETWGGSGLNGRRHAPTDAEGRLPRSPVAWRFVEGGRRGVHRVPPAFIDLYGPPWVGPAPSP